MKKLTFIFISFLTVSSLLLLTSCNDEGDFFKIEGRLSNIYQGEFYVYSTDGGIDKLDTIKLQDGRFAYQTFISQPATFVIVFPNFSEQPVFGEPGRTAKIKGDATHLKEMEVSGTKENKLMTEFRKHTIDMTPPQQVQAVEDFVMANPQSLVATYIIQKYLVQSVEPKYKLAAKLLKAVIQAQPGNKNAKQLKNKLQRYADSEPTERLPEFNATTIQGKKINQNFCKGKVGVIVAWAQNNYESTSMKNRMKDLYTDFGKDVAILGISLDADKKQCKAVLDNDGIEWDNICDGNMFLSPVVDKLGIAYLPDNIVIDKSGKIVARGLTYDDLRTKVETLVSK